MSTTTASGVPVGVSDASNGEVFRFHVRKIRSPDGEQRHPALLIDLDPSRHGLYDLVQIVLQVRQLPDLPAETILQQRRWWDESLLEFIETKFAYGLTYQQLPQEEREGRRCCNVSDPQVLNTLDRSGFFREMGFQIGMKGKFNRHYKSFYRQNPGVSFEFELVYMCEGTLNDGIEYYECESVVTEGIQQEVANLRDCYQDYKRYGHGYGQFQGRPIKLQRGSPPWSPDEEGILSDLIALNCRFSTAWNELLWYAFVDRTKSAAEQHYRVLKKNPYYPRLPCRRRSLQEVQQDCLERMYAFLERGDPNEFPMLDYVENVYHTRWD